MDGVDRRSRSSATESARCRGSRRIRGVLRRPALCGSGMGHGGGRRIGMAWRATCRRRLDADGRGRRACWRCRRRVLSIWGSSSRSPRSPGLVLFARLADSWLLAATGKSLGWIASPVALTLTATFTTIPITVSTFGMLSLVSPVANVVVGPLVSAALLIGLGGLAAHAVWASAGTLLLKLAAWPAALAVRIAHEMAAWPYAAVPLGAICCASGDRHVPHLGVCSG